MKKMAVKITALLFLGLSQMAWADAVSELQTRLNKVDVLSADYVQKVSDAKGKEIQQGKGKLRIKRPNLFRMDNQSPQESQIVSDGKTLWFYDPFVQQVTANWVSEAVNNTPFVLLTSNDQAQWKKYTVAQSADTFTLKPKFAKSNIKQFNIRIDADGVLKNFSTTEKDGQTNLYLLRNITNQPLADNLFKFSVPKGAELDDQRKKK
ncbi:outer-membrane lipoprotein carrier protein LolA [Avibacterium gallinarum]|uniref:Outer-membrane lipoprotein carrier protein n=1 Tax=Avibacterium gallinarum TaxID=755 RepID=A0A379AVF8_AVIGA|nr:outer membrane lipoprotein chaperone LolA [Avibacterium gallinarum]POY44981.1 outer-membrane lipoprotein carrier protein LolA [Avibacterium gallinarum]TDP28902.1 outer membrane lipoprotein carrier protein [Avibacterium gallinarum]SUB26315.1 outer-membrane lipoprotein carrier protein [Avibacterium gallinarum]